MRCPRTITELFIEGTQSTRADDWHWLIALDTRNGLLAGPNCPPQFTMQKLYTLYPAEAQGWVQRQGISQPPEAYSPLCPDRPTADRRPPTADSRAYSQLPISNSQLPISSLLPIPPRKGPTGYSLLMTSPDQGSRYRLSPEIPQAAQQVTVAVRLADSVTLSQVTLLANGRPLATLTRPPYQALWPMRTGTHVFTAVGVDAEGNELKGNSVVIEVIE